MKKNVKIDMYIIKFLGITFENTGKRIYNGSKALLENEGTMESTKMSNGETNTNTNASANASVSASVNAKENFIKSMSDELLSVLLKDRTTNKNLIWATNNYAKKGIGYGATDEIKLYVIKGKTRVIKPRIEKSKAEQTKRSKDNAEVFTPSWIVNKQNNLVDNAWFGRENVFNTENDDDKTWTASEGKIKFESDTNADINANADADDKSNNKNNNKSWKDYVTEVRLEMCCGEAPYLVSRYDTVTGEMIPLYNRVGLLDRKFRVIDENAKGDEWLEYAIKAVKSVYGYEFQGDNLVIARENILLDFCDYYENWFGTMPSEKILLEVLNIISWNIWQMDGLSLVVPFSCHEETETATQMSFFEEDNVKAVPEICKGCKTDNPKLHNGKRCHIMDWEKNKRVKYVSLLWRSGTYVG